MYVGCFIAVQLGNLKTYYLGQNTNPVFTQEALLIPASTGHQLNLPACVKEQQIVTPWCYFY